MHSRSSLYDVTGEIFYDVNIHIMKRAETLRRPLSSCDHFTSMCVKSIESLDLLSIACSKETHETTVFIDHCDKRKSYARANTCAPAG
jgi:hypothetical protein